MSTTLSRLSMATAIVIVAGLISGASALDLSSTSSVLATPSPSPSSQSIHYPLAGPDPSRDADDSGECRLLGPFSLLVQAALGALALLSLVYKRWRERPQRPVKVWAFDVSKQVFGSAMLHLANLLMSMFSAGQLEITSDYKPNPCSFYLLNLGIDTTLVPFIVKVGDWALRWTEGNAAVQIFFVMLLFPVIMNAIQYYIIDTFIKKPSHQLLEEEGRDGDCLDDDHDHRHALLAGLEDDGTLVSEDGTVGKDVGNGIESPPRVKEALTQFDATEYPTIRGESSSGSSASIGTNNNSFVEDDLISSSMRLTAQQRDP
ncbi:uncharacterized protein ATNIH1004_002670 [Aspergillus tanneri]|uniref:Vacuolar membrane protein n=1 Tax=Aspergillus tanneri TaxID=1220188 RepID=A0A5M9MXB3_9EURO|nr:uncharacterized protein ATNIH1004_002670 [Aspergillus tanneri]KAA8649990.1 hypothetical protein ATNIH1004_002670 [Aspergillus tanneri]